MSSGTTAQDGAWKEREQSEEAKYVHAKEQEQLAALRAKSDDSSQPEQQPSSTNSEPAHGYEGGYGGQEDLIDRYATTSGEH